MPIAGSRAGKRIPYLREIRKYLFASIIMIAATGAWALSGEAATCMACHAYASMAPVVDLGTMDASVHASFDCTTCHPGASKRPHDMSTVKADCATCHSGEQADYAKGVHGQATAQGDTQAATCTSCHGDAHGILPSTDPGSTVYHANLPRTCGQCHSKGKLPKSTDQNVNNAFDLYTDSIHGTATMKSGLLAAANCSDCHGSHDIRPKSDPASTINRANIPETCGKCHVDVLRDWKASSHAQAFMAGNDKAPVCTDCHVAHTVMPVDDPRNINALMFACSRCHKPEFGTYRDTFHGEVTEIGDLRTATCASCHGDHLVLPASDPRSPTSPQRLVSTCQKCHPEANVSFTEYRPHAAPMNGKQFPQLHAIWLFMTTLLVVVFSFFGLHTLLWLFHSLRTRKRAGKEDRDVR